MKLLNVVVDQVDVSGKWGVDTGEFSAVSVSERVLENVKKDQEGFRLPPVGRQKYLVESSLFWKMGYDCSVGTVVIWVCPPHCE